MVDYDAIPEDESDDEFGTKNNPLPLIQFKDRSKKNPARNTKYQPVQVKLVAMIHVHVGQARNIRDAAAGGLNKFVGFRELEVAQNV